jgi:hypothetical protein
LVAALWFQACTAAVFIRRWKTFRHGFQAANLLVNCDIKMAARAPFPPLTVRSVINYPL